jgi:glycerol-3-phosphate dehydrogenase (NAD(P)+)
MEVKAVTGVRKAARTARTNLLIVGYGAFGRAVHACLSMRDDVATHVYSRSPKTYDRAPETTFDDIARVALGDYDVVVVALPGHAVREVLQRLPAATGSTAFLSCVKGLDPESGMFPSDVIYQATGSDYVAVMSGASFADEMLLGRPVFLTLACANESLGRDLIERLNNPVLRLELSDDVRGLEIAGVGKNIIALGAGLADGLELGDNFRAAFIARGIVELRHVAEKFGGRADTIVATGALADFILSCSSTRSRNYTHGWHLARGDAGADALAEGRQSAESFVRVLQSQHIRSTYFETIAAALANPRLIGGSLN